MPLDRTELTDCALLTTVTVPLAALIDHEIAA